MSTAPPALPSDIEAGLRRLRLSAIRMLSPELLVTAKTQRWKPEEFLRTLIEAEIASRDASNAVNRLKAAAFPVTKTLDEFDVAASSVKPATFAICPASNGSGPRRIFVWSVRRERARATCSSPSATRPSKPGSRCATSARSSWSRPSIGGWRTTRSAGSLRESSKQT